MKYTLVMPSLWPPIVMGKPLYFCPVVSTIFFYLLLMAAVCNREAIIFLSYGFLWPPCVADADIIFSSCFYLSLFLSISFPRLISAVADWMSTILAHMVWP